MIILRILLFPFSVLYDLITSVRNRFYDKGLRPSIRFELPVIGIGNLTVGGTGKTPLTEYLIRLLAREYNVATLSRGYGRKTRGFYIAKPSDTAASLGDEPFQLYQKYKDKVVVAVGEDRAFAVPNILQEHPETSVILLDDAYQHRTVSPSTNILLSDFNRPFYQDFVMPAGRLRESRTGAKRADIIIVTKCPPVLSAPQMKEIQESISRYGHGPIFFSHIRYGKPQAFGSHTSELPKQILLVTGIAQSGPLVKHVQEHFDLVKHIDFNDHHHYTIGDIARLKDMIKEFPHACILTTEKDKVKLESVQLNDHVHGLPLFYLPIEVAFNKDGEDFDTMILKSLQRAG